MKRTWWLDISDKENKKSIFIDNLTEEQHLALRNFISRLDPHTPVAGGYREGINLYERWSANMPEQYRNHTTLPHHRMKKEDYVEDFTSKYFPTDFVLNIAEMKRISNFKNWP